MNINKFEENQELYRKKSKKGQGKQDEELYRKQ